MTATVQNPRADTLLIYPDTNIWNRLCDAQIDPEALLESLARGSATLVISFHTVCELARTFLRNTEPMNARGRQLFSYVARFLDLGMPSTKIHWEMFRAEAHAFCKGKQAIDPLATGKAHAELRDAVQKLSHGVVEGKVIQLLSYWHQFTAATRAGQQDFLIRRPDVKARLEGIPKNQLPQWMQERMLEPTAVGNHFRRLQSVLGLAATMELAQDILRSPNGETARAFVRGDLYYNWHCANFDSISSDRADDIYHILHAVHCDFYVTAEPGQATYADMLLTPKTKVSIHDPETPVDQWLDSLAPVPAGAAI